MIAEPKRLECHRCGTGYRVRNLRALRERSGSTCRKCGTRFVVAAVEDSGPSAEASVQPGLPGSSSSTEQERGSCHPKEECLGFSFNGAGGSLFGIQIVNVFLTLLSLGLYHFWAKVRVRKYMFSQTQYAGDRFAYHGTGRELLVGFARASLVFGLPYALLTFVPEFWDLGSWVKTAAQWSGAALIFLFVPLAVISARRYRLSRTSWRGIRFSFRGRTWDFLKLMLKGTILTALTLGAYYPYFQVERQRFLISHAYFGNRAFCFHGHGSGLVPSYVAVLLGTPALLTIALVLAAVARPISSEWFVLWTLLPYFFMALTIGPLWLWFLARKHRYFWSHTTLGPAQCRSTVSGRGLLNLQVENLFLLILTLGFAWTWATVRTTRFYLSNLTLTGSIDLGALHQDTHAVHPTGEGLADLLDVGFEMD